MTIDLAGDLATLFSTDDLAAAGVYTPDGKAPVAVKVHLFGPGSDASLGLTGFVDRGWTAHVLASEVASPGRLDKLVVDGKTFLVQKVTPAEDARIFVLELDERG